MVRCDAVCCVALGCGECVVWCGVVRRDVLGRVASCCCVTRCVAAPYEALWYGVCCVMGCCGWCFGWCALGVWGGVLGVLWGCFGWFFGLFVICVGSDIQTLYKRYTKLYKRYTNVIQTLYINVI